jgi:hypothetical protein
VTVDLRPLVGDVETPAAGLTYNILDTSHGTLTPTATNGVFTFSPSQNYNGTTTITYSVTDTGDGSSPALTSASATAGRTWDLEGKDRPDALRGGIRAAPRPNEH